MATKTEDVAGRIFDLFTEIEDVKYVAQSSATKNDKMDTILDLLNAISKKLDLSNAKPAEEENMLDAINRRVGEAYGTYIKVLGIANRDKDSHKDIGEVHADLEGLGASFKKLVSSVNELSKG